MDEEILNDLLKEIKNAGFDISNYHQLWTLKSRYNYLTPILLKYLKLFQTKNEKEFIVRALGVKGFYDATFNLLEEYHNSDNIYYKWAIGNSLSIILDGRFEDKYIEIINNKQNGISRQMIVLTLGKLKSNKAIDSFITLLDDDEINGHIVIALGYFKNIELIKFIEPFLQHKNKWIRREAEKSIKKIKQ